jgi:prevent-host-death family protein
MASVGVRELRQRASELLRRVEAGETIEVTDRGRPVAVLAPLPDEGGLARLRRAGQTDGPDATFGELPEPLMPAEGARLPSEVLAELRRGER